MASIPQKFIEILMNIILMQNQQLAEIIGKNEGLKRPIVLPTRQDLRTSLIAFLGG